MLEFKVIKNLKLNKDLTDILKNFALFKQIVALGYLIQQKYHNDIRNMLP